jgi:hypothetical protein
MLTKKLYNIKGGDSRLALDLCMQTIRFKLDQMISFDESAPSPEALSPKITIKELF